MDYNCPHCNKSMALPRLLNCLHTFCTECVQSEITKALESNKTSFKCPECECNMPIPKDVDELPLNTYLMRRPKADNATEKKLLCDLCVNNSAVNYCVECEQNVCEYCAKIHLKAKVSRSHQLKDVNDSKDAYLSCVIKCGAKPDGYCRECEAPVCIVCRLDHSNHLVEDLERAEKHIRQSMRQVLSVSKTLLDEVSKFEGDKLFEELRANDQMISDRLRDSLKAIRKAVEERFNHLERQFEILKRKRDQDALELYKTGSKETEELRMAVSLASAIVEQGDVWDLLSHSKPVKNKLKSLHTTISSMRGTKPLLEFQNPNQDKLILDILELGRIYIEGDAHPKSTKILNKISRQLTSKVTEVMIATYSNKGKKIERGGHNFTVHVEDPSGELVGHQIKDFGNGEYKVSFTGSMKGEHRVSIMMGSDHIVGSPFNIYFIEKRDYAAIEKPVTTFGTNGKTAGQFSSPVGVAVTEDGKIIVADYGNNCIMIFDSNGLFLRSIGRKGPLDGELSGPCGICINQNGEIVVVDSGNHRIQIFNIEGQWIMKVGQQGNGHGQFTNPIMTVQHPNGNYYVTERSNNRIQAFDSNWNFLFSFGSQGHGQGNFLWPAGICVDAKGRIVVADLENGRLQVFTETGEFIQQIGSRGTEVSQFIDPYGVAATIDGHIAVVEDNHRVQIFDLDGNHIHHIGGLNRPRGITVDKKGRMIVSHKYQIVIY